MKKALLACVCLLSGLPAFSHSIDSFYQQGAEWINMYKWNYTVPSSYPPYYTRTDYVEGFKLHIGGDTIVSSISYKKVYCTPIGLFESTSTQPYKKTGKFTKYTDPPMYIGRLRVVNRKVYFTDEGDSKMTILGVEHIMHDFSGNVGDTIERLNYPYKVVVTKVDSIILNSGDTVRRYYYDGSTEHNAIEGIGPVAGTLADLRTIVGLKPGIEDVTTVCYTSGKMFYKFPVSPAVYDWYLPYNCFDLDVLGVEDKANMQWLSLYPNPSSGNFTIEGKTTAKEMDIAVYDVLGRKVFSSTGQVVDNVMQHQMSLTGVPAGQYRVVISSADGQQVLPVSIE